MKGYFFKKGSTWYEIMSEPIVCLDGGTCSVIEVVTRSVNTDVVSIIPVIEIGKITKDTSLINS